MSQKAQSEINLVKIPKEFQILDDNNEKKLYRHV